ncbi:DUF6114 domain-containing protein [Dactylosporangium sp. NBC_01737]|uniref:DUF6114 domain-containing protein n=1 Tax=Dactylosporangium sp. NBC_01737 TaxID=2975959 RepID=UPI002E15286B|nr:DUF6114 domain-containing protein [Dactylosporangium sp. NBC_01737]
MELFLSANLKLALEVHFGPTGFLSYVIPAMLLLCGVLTWVSPGQRLFYGILGTLTALYSIIGLNLGGFFLGMILGVVGGGLAAAWSPGVAPATEDAGEEDDAPAYERAPLNDLFTEDQDNWPSLRKATDPAAYDEPTREQPAFDFDEPAPRHSSGVLTDSLPSAQRSPLHDDYEASTGGAGSADDERPPTGHDGLPRRRGRGVPLFALLLTGAVAGAALFGATNGAAPASAAPAACASPSVKTSTGTQPAPSGGATSASPSPSPSPTKTEEEKPGLLDWLGGLFGGGKQADPVPSASATTAPALAASPTTSAAVPGTAKSPAKATACPSASASINDKKAKVAEGQPHVAAAPSILLADTMTMDGLVYDGVAELTKKDGSKVKVLAFSMKNSVSTPFELRTPGAPKLLLTKSSKLTVEGNVKFYTSKFSAKVLGIIPLTFTPSFPPPPIPLPGYYTDCEIELVYVQSNVLTAAALSIAYAS